MSQLKLEAITNQSIKLMDNTVAISIITPCPNRAEFLAWGISNILSHSYRKFGLLFTDTGTSNASLNKMRVTQELAWTDMAARHVGVYRELWGEGHN